MKSARILAVLAASLLGVGCFSVSYEPGQVACGPAGECPGDWACQVGSCWPADYAGPFCDHSACDINATCNEGSPPSCTCNSGYDGDGLTCADVDECATGGDNCDVNASCTNTDGGFTCTCNTGYQGTGDVCTDRDECADGSNDCDPNAICTNTEGSFDCACGPGWNGDGRSCTDIDECATNPCNVNATCQNTPGSFVCTCAGGFYGDGFTCNPIIGQAILIGHDDFERNADVDRIIGNAVLMANTTGPIEVIGYQQYSDTSPGGEVENTNASIQATATAAGRTVNITPVSDYTAIPAMLATAHVLLIYEMELGGDAVTIGSLAAPYVHDFMMNGGVVVGCDYAGTTWQVMNYANVIHNAGVTGYITGQAVTVAVPNDPLAAGMPPTYTATNGSSSYQSNDGIAVVVDSAGNPVVLRKLVSKQRFSGAFGAAWEPVATTLSAAPSMTSYRPAHIPFIYNMYGGTGQTYDPATNTWANLPNALPYSNYWFDMAYSNSKLYGFANNNNLYRFDTQTNAWTTAIAFTGSAEYTMTASDEYGIVYGYINNGNILAYNPITNSITTYTSGIAALRGGNGSLFETRLVYDPPTRSLYLGGFGSPELYRFDLNTLSVTQLTSIPEPTLNDIFCADRAGHIYAAGDTSGSTLYQYDIGTDTWTSLPTFPISHGNDGSCAVSEDGYIYVNTGEGSDFNRLALY